MMPPMTPFTEMTIEEAYTDYAGEDDTERDRMSYMAGVMFSFIRLADAIHHGRGVVEARRMAAEIEGMRFDH